MDLISKMGLQDPFYPKSAIVTAFEEVEQRLCCIEKELEPLGALCGPGGVVFTNAANEVINDCNEFFWDNAIKELGIGTNTPSSKLHVYSLTDSVIATFESIAGNAIISLLSHDNYGSYINYQENTSGDQWQVGENGTTGEFEWIDGNDFGLNLRAGFTRSGQLGVGSATSLRLYDGQVGGQSYFSLRANNVMASDNDYVWPAGYPAGAGDVLSSDLAGQLSWIPAGGGSPWTLDVNVNLFASNSFPPIGNNNIIAGGNAGSAGLIGFHNLVLGSGSLIAAANASVNIALGLGNFTTLISGTQNIAIGSNIAPLLTTGDENILLGQSPGALLPQQGDYNLLIGSQVGLLAGLNPVFPVIGTGYENILIGKKALSEVRDILYPAPASVAQVAFHDIIGIGLEAANYTNSYNSIHSIFLGNYSSPIMSDISAVPIGAGLVRKIVSLTAGTRNMTAGGATNGAGQIVLYGHESGFPTSGKEGKMLMVGGGNTGDYNSTGNTYHETPNASLHVSGIGSQDATYITELFPIVTYADDHLILATDGAGVSAGIPVPTTMFAVDHDGQIKMPNIPTGAGVVPAGLVAGSVWHDTTTDNLKLVP